MRVGEWESGKWEHLVVTAAKSLFLAYGLALQSPSTMIHICAFLVLSPFFALSTTTTIPEQGFEKMS